MISQSLRRAALWAAVGAVVAAPSLGWGQTITLQKQNSIALGTQFLTGGVYGDNALSVAFDGTNAYIGGFNSAATGNTVGVVRVSNALTGTTAFTGLAGSAFAAVSGRGLDGLAADASGVYLAYDDGSPTATTNTLSKIRNTDGTSIWSVATPSIAGGYRPSTLAIDPKANAGGPALAAIGVGSGRRAAFDLATGSTLYAPSGGTGSLGLGEIINGTPGTLGGISSVGNTYRAIAFDSAGNVAVTGQGGTAYGQRDTVGGTNFNRIVNPLDPTKGSETRPILVKGSVADPAGFVAQGLAFLEGLGGSPLLVASERVGATLGYTTTLKTATDRAGGFTTSAAVDTRNVLLRNVDGSIPSNLASAVLKGDEDGLGNAYAADLKNFAVGRDANNNPVLLVLDYASKRLDIFGVEPQYVAAANGNWSTASNWVLNALPDSRTTNATFANAAAPRTVTLDSARTVKQLKFDSANRFTIAGTATLTLAAPVNDGDTSLPAYITVKSGSHTVNAPIVLGSNARFDVPTGSTLTLGTVDGSGKGLTKRDVGSLEAAHIRVNTLVLEAGVTKILANGTEAGISRLAALNQTGGTIDLTNNGLIVDYDAAAATPFDTLYASVKSNGIFSSLTDSSRTLGVVERGTATTPTFTDPTLLVDASTVLIRYTLRGDANLDKTVNFDDLLTLAQNYDPAGSNKVWGQGDANYDGVVNFDDLLVLAQNYGSSLLADGALLTNVSSDFASDFALARSLVPEPATLGTLAAVGLGVARRRRR